MAMRSDTGAKLAQRWGVSARHALYRETGDWYHNLKRFPGALFDKNGYIIFESQKAYKSCPQLRIRQDLNVPDGISRIPGYVQVVVNGVERAPRSGTSNTYEREMQYREGAAFDVVQTRYERDPNARRACLKHYGYSCAVCSMKFSERYGDLGRDFIHVHHLKQISGSSGEHDIDPIADLVPVCPNCHAMLHRRNPPLSIADLKKYLEGQQ